MRQIFVFLLFSLILSMPVEAAQNRHGGHMVLSLSSDPKTFNPMVSKDKGSSEVVSFLFEGLTTTDPKSLRPKPLLATHWDVDPSGLKWTFYLRRDVKWFDGVSFTAHDVVFTFNDIIFNPDIPCSARDIFLISGKPIEVKAKDDFTVEFILPAPFAPFLEAMSQTILPKHRLNKAVSEKRFAFTWGIDTPVKDLIGTGPYRLISYIPGQRLIYEPNPLYWQKDKEGQSLPYLQKITLLIIPSVETELLKFLDGQLDVMDVSGMNYPILKPLEKERQFKIYRAGPNFGSQFLVLNQNPGINPQTQKPYIDPIVLSWFKDKRFRQALAYAVDREKMINISQFGFGVPQYGPMSPSSGFFYNPHITTYPFSLAKSKELLQEAGFYLQDGALKDKNHHPVRFTILLPADPSGTRSQNAFMLAQDLRSLGMKVDVLSLEFNVLVSRLTSSYDWEAVLIALTGGTEPHFGRNVWHSSGALHMWNPRQQVPATEWEKRIDEIFDEGVTLMNDDARKNLYDEFQRIVSEQAPMIYTTLGENMFAVRERFQGIEPSPLLGVLYNIQEIYLKKKTGDGHD